MTLTNDHQARQQATDLSVNPLVMAPAGSGKTGLLIQRLLRALSVCEKPEEVLAITFTNKAANEIVARVLSALGEQKAPTNAFEEETQALVDAVKARDAKMGWRLEQNPARLNIMTIDKLNAMLASQMPVETGMVKLPRVESNPSELYMSVVMELFADLERDDVPAEEKDAIGVLLSHANNRQDEVADLLATMLGERQQWMDDVLAMRSGESNAEDAVMLLIDADIAALNDSVGELLMRAWSLAQSGAERDKCPWVTDEQLTVDSDAIEQVRGLMKLFLTGTGTVRKKVTARDGFPARQPSTVAFNELLADLGTDEIQAFEAAHKVATLIPSSPYSDEAAELNDAMARVLVRALGHLHVMVGDTGTCDFSEIAIRAIKALVSSSGIGTALQKLDYIIKHILVDEMQDTNAAQFTLLSLLTEGWMQGDGRSLFMVGDPQQSIYGFRRADVRLFLKLWEEARFGELPLECLRLSANFRSSGDVVDYNNRVFSHVLPTRNDIMRGAVTSSPSEAVHSSDGQSAATCYFSDSADAQVSASVTRVLEILAQNPNDSIAVLGRNRRQLRPVLKALKVAGVHASSQDIDTMATDAPVNDVLSLISALWHPMNRNAWVRFLRSPLVGMTYQALDQLLAASPKQSVVELLKGFRTGDAELQARIDVLNGALHDVSVKSAVRVDMAGSVKAIFARLGGARAYVGLDKENIDALFALLRKHTPAGSITNMDAFLEAVDSLFPLSRPSQVQVMTIHKSKGLEFDHVLVVGMQDKWRPADTKLMLCRPIPEGTLLSARPNRDGCSVHAEIYSYIQQLETSVSHNEEGRLLYVALTRAKNSLHLFAFGVLDGDGFPVCPQNSFLGLMQPFWARPVICNEVEDFVEQAAEAFVPTTWISKATDAPVSPNCFSLTKSRVRAASKTGDAEAADASYAAVAIGTAYHSIMETIGKRGIESWRALGDDACVGIVRARLVEAGLVNGTLQGAVEVVSNLVGKTLRSNVGRWVLDKHDEDYYEYPIVIKGNAGTHSVRLDRLFFDNGQWWLVDYKSDRPDNYAGGAKGLVEYYRPQLNSYREAIAELPFVGELRVAIYSPHCDELLMVT